MRTYISTATLLIVTLTGCSTGEIHHTRSEAAIELIYDSRFILNLPRTRIYRDGMVCDERYGETNVFRIPAAEVHAIVAKLESHDFFQLTREAIISRLHPDEHGFIIDASTVTVSVALPHRRHTV